MGFAYTVQEDNKPVAKCKDLAHVALLLANTPNGSLKYLGAVVWNNRKHGHPGIGAIQMRIDAYLAERRKQIDAIYGRK